MFLELFFSIVALVVGIVALGFAIYIYVERVPSNTGNPSVQRSLARLPAGAEIIKTGQTLEQATGTSYLDLNTFKLYDLRSDGIYYELSTKVNLNSPIFVQEPGKFYVQTEFALTGLPSNVRVQHGGTLTYLENGDLEVTSRASLLFASETETKVTGPITFELGTFCSRSMVGTVGVGTELSAASNDSSCEFKIEVDGTLVETRTISGIATTKGCFSFTTATVFDFPSGSSVRILIDVAAGTEITVFFVEMRI